MIHIIRTLFYNYNYIFYLILCLELEVLPNYGENTLVYNVCTLFNNINYVRV